MCLFKYILYKLVLMRQNAISFVYIVDFNTIFYFYYIYKLYCNKYVLIIFIYLYCSIKEQYDQHIIPKILLHYNFV